MTPTPRVKNAFPQVKEYFSSDEKNAFPRVKKYFSACESFFPGEEDVLLECQAHSKSKTQKNRFGKKMQCPH